jgi:hypothetical protein
MIGKCSPATFVAVEIKLPLAQIFTGTPSSSSCPDSGQELHQVAQLSDANMLLAARNC